MQQLDIEVKQDVPLVSSCNNEMAFLKSSISQKPFQERSKSYQKLLNEYKTLTQSLPLSSKQVLDNLAEQSVFCFIHDLKELLTTTLNLIISTSPQSSHSYLSQALLKKSNKENYEAKLLLKKALELDKNNHYAHYFMASISQFANGSEKFVKKALGIQPKNPIFLNRLGLYALKNKEFPKSENFFQRALKYDSEFYLAYDNLGEVNLLKGDLDQAIHFYKQAIGINPRTWILNDSGSAFMKVGKHELAAECFAEVHKREPGSALILGKLGEAYLNMNSFQKAEEQFKRSIALENGCIASLKGLGDTFEKQGLYKRALKAYKEGIKYDSNFNTYIQNLLIKQGKNSEKDKFSKISLPFEN